MERPKGKAFTQRFTNWLVCALIFFLGAGGTADATQRGEWTFAAPVPDEASGKVEIDDGKALLIWEPAQSDDSASVADRESNGSRVQVEQTYRAIEGDLLDKDFIPEVRIIYEGTADRRFVSGLPDGITEFRVRPVDAEGAALASWSEPLVVEVTYRERWQVFLLVGLGLITFFVTVAIIVVGSYRTRFEQNGGEEGDS